MRWCSNSSSPSGRASSGSSSAISAGQCVAVRGGPPSAPRPTRPSPVASPPRNTMRSIPCGHIPCATRGPRGPRWTTARPVHIRTRPRSTHPAGIRPCAHGISAAGRIFVDRHEHVLQTGLQYRAHHDTSFNGGQGPFGPEAQLVVQTREVVVGVLVEADVQREVPPGPCPRGPFPPRESDRRTRSRQRRPHHR